MRDKVRARVQSTIDHVNQQDGIHQSTTRRARFFVLDSIVYRVLRSGGDDGDGVVPSAAAVAHSV
jgi:hypothetical protein